MAFRKGSIPWNKGIKTGFVPKTAFKKGNKTWNTGLKTGIIPKSAFKQGHISGIKGKEITWKVDENGCWICTSHAPDTKGYPQKRINGKKKQISRIIYTEKFGEIPENIFICHTCDNPSCINIEHLFPAPNVDNVKDKVMKNRQSRMPGEQHPMAKLTEQQVKEIRNSKDIGCRKLAEIYNVTHSTIAYIRKGKLWKHLLKEVM
jgi:DNA-binding XRE family transcriptional regulator